MPDATQADHRPGPAILSDPRSSLIQRRIDVDLFVVSLHRLHTVAELAAVVADPRNILSGALERFSGLTAGLPLSESEPAQPTTIASVRNAFEHGQNLAIRGGLGLASGPDGWWISYRDRMFQTKDLLEVGDTLQDHSHRLPAEVEITNPRHPLAGQRVPVVSGYRWHGRAWLTVMFPDGFPARIPVRDTDLAGTQVAAAGGTVLSVSGIRRLRELACGRAVARDVECPAPAAGAGAGRGACVGSPPGTAANESRR
jgi:hypothetical protein